MPRRSPPRHTRSPDRPAEGPSSPGANVCLSAYARLRVEVRKERAEVQEAEARARRAGYPAPTRAAPGGALNRP